MASVISRWKWFQLFHPIGGVAARTEIAAVAFCAAGFFCALRARESKTMTPRIAIFRTFLFMLSPDSRLRIISGSSNRFHVLKPRFALLKVVAGMLYRVFAHAALHESSPAKR